MQPSNEGHHVRRRYVLLKNFESLQHDHCIDKFRLADHAESVKLAGVAVGRAALLLEGLLSLRRGPSEAAQGAGGVHGLRFTRPPLFVGNLLNQDPKNRTCKVTPPLDTPVTPRAILRSWTTYLSTTPSGTTVWPST